MEKRKYRLQGGIKEVNMKRRGQGTKKRVEKHCIEKKRSIKEKHVLFHRTLLLNCQVGRAHEVCHMELQTLRRVNKS